MPTIYNYERERIPIEKNEKESKELQQLATAHEYARRFVSERHERIRRSAEWLLRELSKLPQRPPQELVRDLESLMERRQAEDIVTKLTAALTLPVASLLQGPAAATPLADILYETLREVPIVFSSSAGSPYATPIGVVFPVVGTVKRLHEHATAEEILDVLRRFKPDLAEVLERTSIPIPRASIRSLTTTGTLTEASLPEVIEVGRVSLIPILLHEIAHMVSSHPERTLHFVKYMTQHSPEVVETVLGPLRGREAQQTLEKLRQLFNIFADAWVNTNAAEILSGEVPEIARGLRDLYIILLSPNVPTPLTLLAAKRALAETLQEVRQGEIPPQPLIVHEAIRHKTALNIKDLLERTKITTINLEGTTIPIAELPPEIDAFLALEPEAHAKEYLHLLYALYRELEKGSRRGTGTQGRERQQKEEKQQEGGEGESTREELRKLLSPFRLLGTGEPPDVSEQPEDEVLEELAKQMGTTKENLKKMMEKMSEELKRKYLETLRRAGTGTGGLRRAYEYYQKGKINWRAHLRTTLLTAARGLEHRRSWVKPSIVAPGKAPGKTKAAVPPVVTLIDTSGSITERDLGYFIKELENILRQVKPSETYVIYWDTEAYGPYRVKTPRQILQARIPPTGGGGTVIAPALQKAIELARRKGAAIPIIFTDAEIFDIAEPKTRNLFTELRRLSPAPPIFVTILANPPTYLEQLGYKTLRIQI